MRTYLAGPDVFFPDPHGWAARRAAICRAHGLDPVSPFDPVEEPAGWATLPEAARIARRNEAHIRSAGAVIANLTPFRGPSADVGTVYETGFARALGLPVFAYSTVATPLAERTGPGLRDVDGLEIENFGLPENLMIACAVDVFVVQDRPRWTDLAAFTACVRFAAARLIGMDYRIQPSASQIAASSGRPPSG